MPPWGQRPAHFLSVPRLCGDVICLRQEDNECLEALNAASCQGRFPASGLRNQNKKGQIMSSKHRHLLESIFRDPISSNIQWREVESLLHHLGAEVEPGHGARFRVLLNRHEFFLHHPHHSNEFGKQELKYLRECLAGAGVTPSAYEEKE